MAVYDNSSEVNIYLENSVDALLQRIPSSDFPIPYLCIYACKS